MKFAAFAAALALVAGTASAGTLVNGDFSNGLNGWTVGGTGAINVESVGAGYRASLFAGTRDVYTSLSQNVSLNVGETLVGDAQFLAHDYMPYNDYAVIKINDFVLFSDNVSNVGNYGVGNMVHFSFTAQDAGTYTFFAGVANALDSGVNSELRVSDIALQNQVPEPASVALLGLGLAGFAAVRRRKNS